MVQKNVEDVKLQYNYMNGSLQSLSMVTCNFKLCLPPELTKYKMFASSVPVLDSFHWQRIKNTDSYKCFHFH